MDTPMLQCIICPGQPRFSDASHLLTHVASKSHLSHYFKLQVRSHQETEAIELLEQYDEWYNSNNLAQLLSDRMTSKDDRKKKHKSHPKGPVGCSVQPEQESSRRSSIKDNSPTAAPALPEYLDPRLANGAEQMEHEFKSEDVSFVSCYATPATSTAIDGHPIMEIEAHLRMGITHSMGDFNHNGEHGEECGRVGNDYNPFPETPKHQRTRVRPDDMHSAMSYEIADPFMENRMPSGASNDLEADKERADEMARLKGILWPGMDIFDSATQQMRRKRNQKKDGNVLKMMEMTSLQVEPTELIFSPTGIFRKQRTITGNVEDDSPLKGETPIPKRRLPRPKKEALRRADPNLPRAQDRRRSKRTVNNNRNKTGFTAYGAKFGSPPQFDGGLKDLGTSYTPDDGELGLAVQAFGKRARNAFTIFADEDDRNKAGYKDQPAHSKPTRETLTPARLVLNSKHDSNDHVGKSGLSALDKENIEPMMTSQGRIGLHGWHSPFPRRNDTDNAGYTPRYYYDEPPHADLGHDDGSETAAYRSNPLLAPGSKIEYYEASSYGQDIMMTHGVWTASPHNASSDATISEEEHHDLAQLYLATHAD
ncbi:hypothetical protein N7456_007672 [Penicillium angulare]|uniref:Uncharacterized protein n=1 Tax=Penicillium angulare TaxID=116970 RepID=A0A9W9FB14_9EURO|nr:hypothetical protein N7456_007672 [Penicillium angulare]